MPVRINSVAITPTVTTVGQPVVVVISAEDITWNNLKNEFSSWGDVKVQFSNWKNVKNFIITTAEIIPDAHCIYDADGKALYDSDLKQVSHYSGGTSQYTASEINSFIREVLNK